MNEFLIQNYLLFAICWFGALVSFLGCIIWIWIPYHFNKTNHTLHDASSPTQLISSVAKENEKNFINHPLPVVHANSPAMRGAAHPSSSMISSISIIPDEPSLHIVRAKSISASGKNVSQTTDTHSVEDSKIDFSILSGEDLERTQLDLAQALFESGRIAFANSILKEFLENATDPLLKMEAQLLLNNLLVKTT